ncbi:MULTISPECIES: hypothetical protein [unclassified Persephonella]|uniref:hypothetical protein n=1 Tax=unclassified Persephonella TaxID=2641955 RepID=UPI0004950D6B|nr:hypothetical protein [Persephonella sp. KM09-Lau-8]
MIIIHYLDDNLITFELKSLSAIPLASNVLSKLKEDLYVDWAFILEELNETVEEGIKGKKINVLEMRDTSKEKIVIISVEEYDLVAIIPS